MDIKQTQQTLAALAERIGPSIAGIGRGWGVGSGAVVARDRLLTSAHAVRGDETSVSFADGRRETASAAIDSDRGLAVLSVATGEVAPVEWAPDSSEIGIGAPVIALANPGGRGLRATLGFACSAGRSFRGPRGRRLQNAIEHTAPMARGSSGAPLVDLEGRLIGLNVIRLDGGLILALAADAELKRRVELLSRGEQPQERRLGLAVAPPRAARRMRRAVGLDERSGLLVRAVEDDSPAGRGGVEPGDLLVAAGERELDGVDALHLALDGLAAGSALELSVVRGTDERSVMVEFDAAESAEQVR